MVKRNNKGAMEMSVGTIVTIVLLMSVLVLGIFFISKIFTSSNNAVDNVDRQLTNKINQLFSSGKASKIAIFPGSREIDIKRGDSPKGFAFSIYNANNDPSSTFDYEVTVESLNGCGSTLTKQIAASYVYGGTGKFTLGPSADLDLARLIRFNVPESAPSCTIYYHLDVTRNGGPYTDAQIIVNLK